MGILNVTPDSFADGGLWLDPSRAVDAALQMEDDGADLIDIGGESTRPGAEPLPLDVELARVLPVIEALAPRLRVPISVDTYKAEVAGPRAAAGAALVNDISALRYDPALADVVARTGAGAGAHAQPRPFARHVPGGALRLGRRRGRRRAGRTRRGGRSAPASPASGVIVDPGIGFAKRAAHSLELLARLPELASLVIDRCWSARRASRFSSSRLGERAPDEREWGTAAAVAAAVLGGAHIVRVHAREGDGRRRAHGRRDARADEQPDDHEQPAQPDRT